MFNFFKRKKPDAEQPKLLPISIDMHSHILPGIDDGAPDLETSLQLVRGLYDLGIRKCIATPHIIGDLYRNSDETIEPALASLQAALAEAAIPMELHAAAEYMLDDYFMELLQSGQPLRTLHQNKLLVELSYISETVNLNELVFNIITAGYQPVLAHPERYKFYHRNMDAYRSLADQGFLLQVNLLSLTGYYGKDVAKAARYILDNNLASFAGTDLHHHRHLAAFQHPKNLLLFQQYINNGTLENRLLAES